MSEGQDSAAYMYIEGVVHEGWMLVQGRGIPVPDGRDGPKRKGRGWSRSTPMGQVVDDRVCQGGERSQHLSKKTLDPSRVGAMECTDQCTDSRG